MTSEKRRTTFHIYPFAVSLAIAASSPNGSVRASEPAPALQTEVDQANEAFKQQRYSDALATYEKVLAITGQAGLLYPIARCHEELGNLESALASYESLVGEPSIPKEARTKAEAGARRLRQRLATGRLILQISPVGAAVRIADRDLGNAPIPPFELPPGLHPLLVEKSGMVTETREVEILPGRATTVTVTLHTSLARRQHTAWPWVGLAASLALVGGGVLAIALGEQDHLSITNADGYREGELKSLSQQQALALDARGDERKLIGWSLFGAGCGLGAASIIFLSLRDDEGTTTIAPTWLGPDLDPGLAITGRF